MKSKNSRLAAGNNNFEEGMFSPGRIVPLVVLNLEPADVTDGVATPGSPEWQPRRGSEAADHVGVDGLLENDEIR